MTSDNTQGKILWVENLRALAIISVIILHVTAPVLTATSPGKTWWLGNIIDSTMRFCVPVLIMLTGSLLLPHHDSLGSFLKKRFLRIALPFLFWTIAYMLYHFYNSDSSFSSITLAWLKDNILYGSAYHLWYVYMILGMYLFIPILGGWIRTCSEKEILYFLAIWIITLFFNLPPLSNWRPAVDLLNFTGYAGYLVLGYYLSVKIVSNKFRTDVIAVLFILTGSIATALGTYFTTKVDGQFNGTFYEYLTPNVLIEACGIFLFVKNRSITNKILRSFISFINTYSFGIYLVHVMIISELAKLGIEWRMNYAIINISLVTFCCLGISGGIIFVLNKLPFGKYISG